MGMNERLYSIIKHNLFHSQIKLRVMIKQKKTPFGAI